MHRFIVCLISGRRLYHTCMYGWSAYVPLLPWSLCGVFVHLVYIYIMCILICPPGLERYLFVFGPSIMAQKRTSDEVKDWFERWFEEAAFKFRRLNTWTPQAPRIMNVLYLHSGVEIKYRFVVTFMFMCLQAGQWCSSPRSARAWKRRGGWCSACTTRCRNSGWCGDGWRQLSLVSWHLRIHIFSEFEFLALQKQHCIDVGRSAA